MNVWIMNLKDTREDKPENLSKTKFDFCKDNNIIGIGWATEESKEFDSNGFSIANNAIDSFEIGDLVWVKDPFAESETNQYYICKVTQKAQETTDSEMNLNDIGKYCCCEYLPIWNLPDDFEDEKLFAIHTIEKANDSVAQKTVTIFNNTAIKNNKNKKKLGIVAILLVAALILGIIFIPKAVSSIQKKTHPVLPDGFNFGMTLDEMPEYILQDSSADILDKMYDEFGRYYPLSFFGEGENTFLADFPLKNEIGEKLWVPMLKLNENKELYSIDYAIKNGEAEDSDFKKVCDYFEHFFGDLKMEKDSNGKQIASFVSEDITFSAAESSMFFVITSPKYEPKIPKISAEAISNAMNHYNYRVEGFSMPLVTLLNSCVSNRENFYVSIREAINRSEIGYTDDIVKKLETDYPQYAATSYLVTIHGDICQNPDLPYLKTEDVDVIRIVFIFDDNENLIDSITLNECRDLSTYAVLKMFG